MFRCMGSSSASLTCFELNWFQQLQSQTILNNLDTWVQIHKNCASNETEASHDTWKKPKNDTSYNSLAPLFQRQRVPRTEGLEMLRRMAWGFVCIVIKTHVLWIWIQSIQSKWPLPPEADPGIPWKHCQRNTSLGPRPSSCYLGTSSMYEYNTTGCALCCTLANTFR